MLKRGLFLFLLLALGMESCSGQQKTDAKVNAAEEPVQKERTFQLPEVPSMLVTPEDRAIYVVQHYWDHFDFTDTAYIHLPDVTEQAMVNFMDLMYHIPASEIEPALETLYGKAAPHAPMLWHFWETMSRYWNDANSPVRDEAASIASVILTTESVVADKKDPAAEAAANAAMAATLEHVTPLIIVQEILQNLQ